MPTSMLLFPLHITPSVIRFAEYLLQNYGIDPEVTWILDRE